MRRTHLRYHANILKRLLIHAPAFNVGLVLRKMIGCGTPRGMAECVKTLLLLLAPFPHTAPPQLPGARF